MSVFGDHAHMNTSLSCPFKYRMHSLPIRVPVAATMGDTSVHERIVDVQIIADILPELFARFAAVGPEAESF